MLTVKPAVAQTRGVAAASRSAQDRLVGAWLGQLGSPRTREAYGRDLAAFMEWCAAKGVVPLEASQSEVASYRDECGEGGVLPATVARRLSALASFYAYARTAQMVAANPVERVGRPDGGGGGDRKRAGLDRSDALALLEAAAVVSPKALVLVALLMLEGLKLAEALALDIDQLEASGRVMHATVVRRGEHRDLPLDARTTRAIRSYLGDRATGPLLVGDSPTRERSTRLTRFGADFLLKRAAIHAGIAPVSANTLRRTHIVLSLRDGTAVEDIALRVGHASVRDTLRYVDQNDEPAAQLGRLDRHTRSGGNAHAH